MISTILLFVGVIAVLVLVHEFGHFIFAKKSGAKVEEFGIGFPPRIFGIKKGETLYSVNLFPVGGFVKIYGEDGDDKKDPRSFSSKTIGTRSLIIAAGVLMNFLLAIVLLSVGHFLGLPQAVEDGVGGGNLKDVGVRIVSVLEDSPAEEAELTMGDVIYSMSYEGETISQIDNIGDVQNFTENHLGKPIVMSLKRGDKILSKIVTPREAPPEGEGPMGIAMVKTGSVSYPIYLAPIKGIESTIAITVGTVKAFGYVLSSLISEGQLGGVLAGPVGIAVMTGQVQRMGFVFLLQFVALISINLALINIFPFPALDGGRLLFLVIEKIKGSPVNQKYEKMAHTIGFAFLILVMIAVTFRDVGRFL